MKPDWVHDLLVFNQNIRLMRLISVPSVLLHNLDLRDHPVGNIGSTLSLRSVQCFLGNQVCSPLSTFSGLIPDWSSTKTSPDEGLR